MPANGKVRQIRSTSRRSYAAMGWIASFVWRSTRKSGELAVRRLGHRPVGTGVLPRLLAGRPFAFGVVLDLDILARQVEHGVVALVDALVQPIALEVRLGHQN